MAQFFKSETSLKQIFICDLRLRIKKLDIKSQNDIQIARILLMMHFITVNVHILYSNKRAKNQT